MEPEEKAVEILDAGATAQEVAQSGEDRRARAAEMLHEPAKPDAAAEKKPGEEAAKEVAQPAAKDAAAAPADAAKPPEKKEEAKGEIEKAPFFNDPVFQEYHKKAEGNRAVVEGFRQLMTEGAYKIESPEQLKLVHADAFLLYDIASGKKEPAELLELLKQNYTAEEFKGVVQKLADYAASMDVVGKKGEANPLEGRLTKLEQERENQRKADDERKQTEVQMGHVNALRDEVKRLCKEKGIDADAGKEHAEEYEDFCSFIAAELGKNKDLVKQIENRQWGEAQRLFTQRFNVLVDRAKRYADGKIVQFETRQKETPKHATGAGADGTSKADTKKINLADGDQRRQAALDQFRASKPA